MIIDITTVYDLGLYYWYMNIDHFMHTYMITQTDLCYNYMYNILNTDSIINISLIIRQINNNYKIQHMKL